VTITGANGYSVTGRALMDFGGTIRRGTKSFRTATSSHTRRLQHHAAPGGAGGFQYEDERGAEPGSSYLAPVERSNYDYRAAVHGDFKSRFFYTLGGDLERYSLFGTQTSPRAGFSFYALRPRTGIFSGTRVFFNYGDGFASLH